MLWLIPAGTHLRIGTLLNSFSPTTSLLSDSSLLAILRKDENYEA
jgi:hypothetical protein